MTVTFDERVFRGESASPNAGGSAPDSDAALRDETERRLRCRTCGANIADPASVFAAAEGRVRHVFANPSGKVYEILTVSVAVLVLLILLLAVVVLDLSAAGRLAHRLQRIHELELSSRELLDALQPPGVKAPEQLPHLWPAGPRPGVYVTTEQKHTMTLMAFDVLPFSLLFAGLLVWQTRKSR